MTPQEQQARYRATCTHYRKGRVIHAIDGSVDFTGTSINAAKREVRSRNLRSYTIPGAQKPQKVTAVKPYVKKQED